MSNKLLSLDRENQTLDEAYSLAYLLAGGEKIASRQLLAKSGLSNASLQAAINLLRSWQLPIAEEGDAYVCRAPFKPMDVIKIAQVSAIAPEKIFLFPTIHSTNAWLLGHSEVLPSGTVCLTEFQTKGRAQRGRVWEAGFGSSLLFSILWKPPVESVYVSQLSLGLGVVAAELLKELGSNISLKWPNDLYLPEGKLGGILVESVVNASRVQVVIIGCGINFSEQTELSFQLRREVAYFETGRLNTERPPIDRNQLVACLLKAWNVAIPSLFEGTFPRLVSRWNALDAWYRKPVKIVPLLGEHGKCSKGIAKGIDQNGAFLIKQGGILERHSFGTVSLLPLSSYFDSKFFSISDR